MAGSAVTVVQHLPIEQSTYERETFLQSLRGTGNEATSPGDDWRHKSRVRGALFFHILWYVSHQSAYYDERLQLCYNMDLRRIELSLSYLRIDISAHHNIIYTLTFDPIGLMFLAYLNSCVLVYIYIYIYFSS